MPNLFVEFEVFLDELLAQADRGVIALPEPLKVYKRLNPIRHAKCNSDELDLGALAFVMPRLPENITSTLSRFDEMDGSRKPALGYNICCSPGR